MIVNFCRDVDGSPNAWKYPQALDAIIGPIRAHLRDSTVSDFPVSGALNVRFHKSVKEKGGVFISHGVADKGWRPAKALRLFDWIGVSGPWWREYYAEQGVDADRLIDIGWPKLDPIWEARDNQPQLAQPKVVWAPTHNRLSSISSYPQCTQLKGWPKDWNVVISPHPMNSEGFKPTLEHYIDADVVIADSGSTIYEAWALGIPVVFPDWLVRTGVMRRQRGKTMEADIYRDHVGRHAGSVAELMALVEEALAEGITPEERALSDRVLPYAWVGRSGEIAAQSLAICAEQYSGKKYREPGTQMLRALEMRRATGGVATVTMKVNTIYKGTRYRPGDTASVPETTAQRWINSGIARKVKTA